MMIDTLIVMSELSITGENSACLHVLKVCGIHHFF